MNTKAEVKTIIENIFNIGEKEVKLLTDYITKNEIVYAVYEGPDNYTFLEKSYEIQN